MNAWLGILLFLALAVAFGLLLGYAAVRFKVEGDPVVEIIDQKLPQTQCGQCGYPGCKPYAEALAKGEADVNLCIPGGEPTMLEIAEILKKDPKPMAAEATEPKPPMVALIDENLCIGCVLCIKACPVDAILGATKMMHTVIAKECTGCELCIPVCPVDCISMVTEEVSSKNWKWPQPNSVTRIPVEVKAVES
ncbi:electron transport complex subunit RsxB [Thiomicrospira sp. ALE5]|uniref:electron transport complex subunit RsxB n=1 Tax=Thiomicrospira sp. ALE5 TaxID=748650 RepID=UPI0008E79539|nr:electron transport complex subunit RsxB [Thiomicrospira sp. ALE5]SFR58645.1 electron transport complex protein RnfB [Thiomicrospira sp. ALE5]